MAIVTRPLDVRTFELIIDGVKTTGDLATAWQYREEDFYIAEIDEVKRFCQWLEDEIGGASHHNIGWLYQLFCNPESEYLQAKATELKKEIQRIKQLLR